MGQVKVESAAGGSDPAGDLDDLPADGGPPRRGQVGRDRGGTSEVERDHGQGDPGGVGRVLPRRQVRQRSVLEFGDDLLDDRVVTVPLVGLDHPEPGVGDEGVVAVGREQFALLGAIGPNRWSRLTRRTISRQVTCSALRRPVNATNGTSATSASLTQRCSASSQIAWGYLIATQSSSAMLAIAAVTVLVIRAVTENQAFFRIAVPTNAHP